MSRYASEATDQQTEQFAAILRTTLTRFYGASLVSYDGEELIFLLSVNLTPIRGGHRRRMELQEIRL